MSFCSSSSLGAWVGAVWTLVGLRTRGGPRARVPLRTRVVPIAVGLLLAGLAGCGPKLGPTYQRVAKIPADRGLVYVYRPTSTTGSLVSFEMHVGDELVGKLYDGSYIPYLARPGVNRFWARTETKGELVVVVQPGKAYYLRAQLGLGTFVGRPELELVSAQQAEEEIAECQLVPRPNAR